jgi:BNR repeat-containing family member
MLNWHTVLLQALLLFSSVAPSFTFAQEYPIADGWARTKVNMTIFRRNAVCSFGDQQVAAFYDADGKVVLARRTHGSSDWEILKTALKGRTKDAHNGISIAFDGAGCMHICWDHHGNPLNYCKTTRSGSLELTPPLPMIGDKERQVTYPEFYNTSDGDLLFFYRDGASGNGNLALNRYDHRTGKWQRMHDNLIDGEGKRNAYWQCAIDRNEAIHLSWVWRETGDVITNHDIAYARSRDGGRTWQKTSGEPYAIPINEATAEYAARIPQNSELANQTSMAVDYLGHPVIANFWRDAPDAVPQYRLVRFDGVKWTNMQVGNRTLNFYRSGGGTKRPPISRPLLLLDSDATYTRAYLIFRDLERERRMSVAICPDLDHPQWRFEYLTTNSVGQADPLIDPHVWQRDRKVHLLSQFVGQGDGEKEEDVLPQRVSLVEWTPSLNK